MDDDLFPRYHNPTPERLGLDWEQVSSYTFVVSGLDSQRACERNFAVYMNFAFFHRVSNAQKISVVLQPNANQGRK